jgi:hypothetical protein
MSKKLIDLFVALEKTLSFIHGRDQIPIFYKIKKSVENIANWTFTQEHLNAIQKIYPEAYIIAPCRVLNEDREWVNSVSIEFNFSNVRGKEGSFELWGINCF